MKKSNIENLPAKKRVDVNPESDFAIGFGYDIFGKYADYESKKTGQFFDYGKIRQEEERSGRKLIVNEKMSNIDSVIHEGRTVSELGKSFKLEAGLSTKIFQFSAEINAAFSTQHEEMHESEFAQYSYTALTRRQYFDMECFNQPEKYMTSNAWSAINGTNRRYAGSEGIKNLIADYGTHIIALARLGGRVDYSMTIRTSEIKDSYDLDAFLKIGYGGFFDIEVEVKTEYQESFKKNASSMEKRVKTLGGNRAVEGKEDLKAWVESVYAGEQVLMGFEKQSLRPIWQFCTDSKRAKEIENYITGEYYNSKTGDLSATRLTKVKLPEFKITDNYLVKKVQVKGITVAEICNEYIPTFDAGQRITVVYPVLKEQTRLDNGFFIGEADERPAKVVWNTEDKDPVILPYSSLKKGKLKEIYLLRGNVCNENPDESIFDVYEGTVSDQVAAGYSRSNYPIVKIGRYFWLKEDYEEVKTLQGTPVTHIRKQPSGSGYYYYNSYVYRSVTFGPIGWGFIFSEQMNYLIEYIGKNNMEKLMYQLRGVSGFDAVAVGYVEKESLCSFNTLSCSLFWKDKKNWNNLMLKLNLHNKTMQTVTPTGEYASLRFVRNSDFKHR